MHRHQDRGGSDHRYRGEILLGVEGQLRINTWINDMAGRHQQQRITVRRRLGGGGRAERAASATAIVDHHRLAQARMQLLAEDAADNIGAAACRVWHNEPDRPRRERFRPANGSGQNYRRTAEQRKEGAAFHVWMAPAWQEIIWRVSGLLVQSGWTAGPDGVREPSPHHSNGIDVPMKRQVWLGCVGSTDCAITRHCSLASSRTWLSGLSRRGHALVVLMPGHHP